MAIIEACIFVTSFAMRFPIPPNISGGELQRNKEWHQKSLNAEKPLGVARGMEGGQVYYSHPEEEHSVLAVQCQHMVDCVKDFQFRKPEKWINTSLYMFTPKQLNYWSFPLFNRQDLISNFAGGEQNYLKQNCRGDGLQPSWHGSGSVLHSTTQLLRVRHRGKSRGDTEMLWNDEAVLEDRKQMGLPWQEWRKPQLTMCSENASDDKISCGETPKPHCQPLQKQKGALRQIGR